MAARPTSTTNVYLILLLFVVALYTFLLPTLPSSSVPPVYQTTTTLTQAITPEAMLNNPNHPLGQLAAHNQLPSAPAVPAPPEAVAPPPSAPPATLASTSPPPPPSTLQSSPLTQSQIDLALSFYPSAEHGYERDLITNIHAFPVPSGNNEIIFSVFGKSDK